MHAAAQQGGQPLDTAALTTRRQPCCCHLTGSLVLKDALTGCLNPFGAGFDSLMERTSGLLLGPARMPTAIECVAGAHAAAGLSCETACLPACLTCRSRRHQTGHSPAGRPYSSKAARDSSRNAVQNQEMDKPPAASPQAAGQGGSKTAAKGCIGCQLVDEAGGGWHVGLAAAASGMFMPD